MLKFVQPREFFSGSSFPVQKHPVGFQAYTVGNICRVTVFRIENECLLVSRTGLLERKTHRNAVQNIDRADLKF